MIIKINKQEILEEKIQLNTPENIQKFSQKSSYKLNNTPMRKAGFGLIKTAVPSTLASGAIGAMIDDEDGNNYIGTGATLGSLPSLIGSAIISKPAGMSKVAERLKRDGYKVNKRRVDTLNDMSKDNHEKFMRDQILNNRK